MKIPALIVGASGYGGGELLRILDRHPRLEVVGLVSRSQAGQSLASIHPRLASDDDPRRFLPEPPWEVCARRQGTIVVFSALRTGELRESLPHWERIWTERALDERLVLVDLSPDYRHQALSATDEVAPAFVYASTEWCRDELVGARRLSSPGCFATALLLALVPLAREKLVSDIVATGVTGSSGSGTSPSSRTHHPDRAQELVAYDPLVHRHQAEVDALLDHLGARLEWAFVPHSGPFVRGIALTVVGRLRAGVDERRVEEVYRTAYAERPQIRLRRDLPRLGAVVGTPYADLAWRVRDGRLAVFVALDNLGKGMASQAVAALNLALGWPEMEGLVGLS